MPTCTGGSGSGRGVDILRKQHKVVQAKSAWFETVERLLEDPEPDFNEIDPADPNWKPQVRRFDGGTIEYAQRDKSADNVMP